jgi:outer membrane protein insertion porin family
LNYQDRNIGGTNDTLSTNLQIASRDLQFDTTFNSPYRLTEPDRDGFTVNAFRKRGLSNTFDGDIKLADGDRIREGKIGGSVSFQRPIDGWDASLGFNYTRVSIRDRNGKLAPVDELGNNLTLSKTGIDDLATVSFTATQDHRNNLFNPTQGSILKLSTEQSIPLGNSSVSMNRVQANFSQFVPVQLYNSKQPQVLAVNFQAGTVIGTLPPYETFNLGGPNSVRGYGSGDVGSGRSYVLASAEYRFPVVKSFGGVLFADFASDLGSGDTVLGNPAGVRNKPSVGFGYGAGIRFDSPLGLLRADYGIGNQGESRLHFGIGQNF